MLIPSNVGLLAIVKVLAYIYLEDLDFRAVRRRMSSRILRTGSPGDGVARSISLESWDVEGPAGLLKPQDSD